MQLTQKETMGLWREVGRSYSQWRRPCSQPSKVLSTQTVPPFNDSKTRPCSTSQEGAEGS